MSYKLHMSNKLPIVFLACTSLALATNAFASHHGERGGHRHHFPISIESVQSRVDERFANADKDGSGTLSLTEFEAVPRRMGEHRRMRHGHKRGQHHANPERRAEHMTGMREKMQDELFTLMDSDGDGSVSKAEHDAADMRALRKKAASRIMFARLDNDNDGQLTREELPDPVSRLNQADTDADGQVTREEMRAARSLHREQRRSQRAS